MRESRFSGQRIAMALQPVKHGVSAVEPCQKLGMGEQTSYRWKRKSGEMAPGEIEKPKQLAKESGITSCVGRDRLYGPAN